MSLLFYRRPDYVAKLPGPMSLAQCQIYVERTQKHKRAIPPELSFENVIQNKALPVNHLLSSLPPFPRPKKCLLLPFRLYIYIYLTYKPNQKNQKKPKKSADINSPRC